MFGQNRLVYRRWGILPIIFVKFAEKQNRWGTVGSGKYFLSGAVWHLKQVVKAAWLLRLYQIRSDQISHSVVSDSLQPHESQHARPPCPSPTPGVHWDSHPSSQWCHLAISSSVIPFFSCPQSLPASESFPMSQLFAWGGQSTGVSALASFLPKKSQGWSSKWTDWTVWLVPIWKLL